MEEQQNKSERPEKKLSRTTLTFYIVGLCAVAIALIVISYILQARTDRQLENLSTKLSEQQSVAQGATQKMEDLQRQLDEKTSELDAVRETLGIADSEEDTAASAQGLRDAQDAAYQMMLILAALRRDEWDVAKGAFDHLTAQYGAGMLDGSGGTTLLGSEGTEIYKALRDEFATNGN